MTNIVSPICSSSSASVTGAVLIGHCPHLVGLHRPISTERAMEGRVGVGWGRVGVVTGSKSRCVNINSVPAKVTEASGNCKSWDIFISCV